MRLINTETIQLEEFEGIQIPNYAILSHRWEREEILFRDIASGAVEGKLGHSKVLECCARARHDGLNYIWVDTCCIDKSSSAELSEAINSMYAWYQRAEVCYAYLSDIRAKCPSSAAPPQLQNEICSSIWFERGWTLQELIAPKEVLFFNRTWDFIGSRHHLAKSISRRTRIPMPILIHEQSPSELTIIDRMAWAASRVTTRLEDNAYSLLGIFEVNMPLLYGEGISAFARLQEEILKRSEDDSFLLFQVQFPTALARSPVDYDRSFPTGITSETGLVGSSNNLASRADTSYEFCHYVEPGPLDEISFNNTGLSITRAILPWEPARDVYMVRTRTSRSFADKECDHMAFIYLRYSSRHHRCFRTRWQGESVRYIRAGNWCRHGFTDLRHVSTKRLTIARNPVDFMLESSTLQFPEGKSYLLDTDYNIELCFERSSPLLTYDSVKDNDIITRAIFQTGPLEAVVAAGRHEAQAILRFWSPADDQTYYLYIGLDFDRRPVVVQKKWALDVRGRTESGVKLATFDAVVHDFAAVSPGSIARLGPTLRDTQIPDKDHPRLLTATSLMELALDERHIHSSTSAPSPSPGETIIRAAPSKQVAPISPTGIPGLSIQLFCSQLAVRAEFIATEDAWKGPRKFYKGGADTPWVDRSNLPFELPAYPAVSNAPHDVFTQ